MGRTGVDYADYNITVYREPCPYSCVYCWAWRVKVNASRISRGKYDPVKEAVKIIRGIVRKREKGARVVISFTTDPYPFREAWENRTREVIRTLAMAIASGADMDVMVLTKNPVLALRDKDLMLVGGVWLGTTITSADREFLFSTVWEPNAPRTRMRLLALREYQKEGGHVWVSLEPLIPHLLPDTYPVFLVETVLSELDPERIRLVVLGRLNYMGHLKRSLPFSVPSEKEACEFYRDYVPEAIDILKEHGIPYHIKKELARCLDKGVVSGG